jgi:hypothetical protein
MLKRGGKKNTSCDSAVIRDGGGGIVLRWLASVDVHWLKYKSRSHL